MPITVKQVASISGVSVRTLHFYDEIGLLKPAFYGTNGYRFYEEAQLLMLQQILFYRELGLDLGQIRATIQMARLRESRCPEYSQRGSATGPGTQTNTIGNNRPDRRPLERRDEDGEWRNV